MGDVLVRAENVYRRYPGTGQVLGGVSFEIRPGDTIAVTGPSGSGKSTLLHVLAGLDHPSSGAVTWPALPEPIRPGPIGVAFQGPSLLPPLTVEENVALPAILAGSEEEAAMSKARQLLLRFGIEDVAERLPEEISGGQSQRTGLARALASDPRLVVADEPTGQLDASTGEAAIDSLLEAVQSIGASLVLATHDLGVARRLANRWSLDEGRLKTGDLRCSA